MVHRRRAWGVVLLGGLAASAALAACGRSSDRGGAPQIAPPVITTTSLPDGEEGVPYSADLQGTGGKRPYTWAITSGSLPPALTLDSASGAITGTPSAVGIFDMTVELSDSQQTPATASASLQLLIYSPSGSSTPPTVMMDLVTGTRRNLVDLSYMLVDPDGDPVTITADVSTDSGATWAPASGGPGGDGTGPLPSGMWGTWYVFQWDSMSDLGPIRIDTVRFRITPADQVTGVAGETLDFTVDNRPQQLVFTAGPSMVEGRMGHTATLLTDGSVLVAGGVDWTGAVLSTAEIYVPASGFFALTPGSMTEPRKGHSATLLPDGRVLIVGGLNASNFELDSAEVFDPVAGTFQAVGSMTQARAGHAVVSTAAGVFVIGGQFLNGIVPVFYDDVDEYDPSADLFLGPLVGALQEERSQHQAHELSNGRILLVGGGPGTNLSVEEFDPALGTSTELSISASAEQLVAHDSVLLQDGRAFVVGGTPGRELFSVISAFDLAFVYDRTGAVGWRWTDVGPMTHSRRWHTATLLNDGRVAVIGGEDNNFQNVDEAELFDPVASTLAPGDRMLTPRFAHVSVLLQDGRVLVTGGTTDGTNVLGQTEFLGP